jgi:hypothetical protein
MEHSSVTAAGGWTSFVLQLGLTVVGTFSVLILISFGGQLIVAPVLLPVQWLIARNTAGWASRAFSLLGGLLLMEVLYLSVMLIDGDSPQAVVAGLLAATGGSLVFIRTSQDGRATRRHRVGARSGD